jgi:DNA-binding NtrC family response regulator
MPEPNPNSHKTILLLEDEPTTRSVLAVALHQAGYHVTCASRERETLALLATKSFDLVITDLLLRELDGIDVVVAIRQNRPGTPVLAMTRDGGIVANELSAKLAQTVGPITILVKPFYINQLLDAVEKKLAAGRSTVP